MKVIVTTCDSHVHLLWGFYTLFNHFWGSHQEVTVLGYKPPNFELPDNFEFVSLGQQTDFPPKSWTDALIPYFDTLQDSHFILLLEECFAISHIDEDLLGKCEDALSFYDASKITLHSEPTYPQAEFHNQLFNHWLSDGDYRSSLTPAIWKTEYFRQLLKPGYTPWDFEIKNMREMRDDGNLILLPKVGRVFPYFAATRVGPRFNESQWQDALSYKGKFGPAEWQVLKDNFSLDIIGRYRADLFYRR